MPCINGLRQAPVPSQSPLRKIHTPSPPLFPQENAMKNISSVITVVVFTVICVLFFHFHVSWSSEMQFGVVCMETWGSTQPHVAFLTHKFRCCFLWTLRSKFYSTASQLTLEKGGKKGYITERNGRSSWKWQEIIAFCTPMEWMNEISTYNRSYLKRKNL